jgi:hypothetical protein
VAIDFALLKRAHLVAQRLAVLCLDNEAIAAELFTPPWSHQEANIGARLQQSRAVKAAQRTGTQDQPPHFRLPTSVSRCRKSSYGIR